MALLHMVSHSMVAGSQQEVSQEVSIPRDPHRSEKVLMSHPKSLKVISTTSYCSGKSLSSAYIQGEENSTPFLDGNKKYASTGREGNDGCYVCQLCTELYHTLLLLQDSKTILFISDPMLPLSPPLQTRDHPN